MWIISEMIGNPDDLCDIPGGVGFLSSSAVILIGR